MPMNLERNECHNQKISRQLLLDKTVKMTISENNLKVFCIANFKKRE